MPVSRVKLVLAYDGTEYRGSQVQPGVPTIQDEVEKALNSIRAFSGRATFAGRTDAGVHAIGQVVSADAAWGRGMDQLRESLNSFLPKDIRVLEARTAPASFNARFDAISREYRYRVATGDVLSPMLGRYAWRSPGSIDSTLASAATAVFRGSHSFGSFASAGKSQARSASELVREVLVSEWRKTDSAWFGDRDGPTVYEVRISATGFLPQMVRNIVAAIIEVAAGKESLEWLEYLLVSGDRRLLGAPAPPHGLILWRVCYEDDVNVGQSSMVEGWDRE